MSAVNRAKANAKRSVHNTAPNSWRTLGLLGSVVMVALLVSALLMQQRHAPDVRSGNTADAAGTRFDYFAPVRAGDTISVSALVKGVFAKTGRSGTMVFAVYQSRYRNQHGVEVAAEEFSRVFRQA